MTQYFCDCCNRMREDNETNAIRDDGLNEVFITCKYCGSECSHYDEEERYQDEDEEYDEED